MSIKKEQLITRHDIYKGRIIHVFQDDVKINGRKASREVVDHCGGAAVLPVTDDGKFLFVRQYRYPIEQALLEIPAGKMDGNESGDVCAARELTEETGYTGKLTHLGDVYTSPGFCNEILHLYLADHLAFKGQHLDPDEYLDVIALSREEVQDLMQKGQLSDAKSLAAIALADRILKDKI